MLALLPPPLILLVCVASSLQHPLGMEFSAGPSIVCLHAEIPADSRSVALSRTFAEYDLLIGDFSVEPIQGTTFSRVLPTGSGVHVLEIGWTGAASTPQQIDIPLEAALYLDDTAIIVDFESREDTEFREGGGSTPFCDGTYSNVLSVSVSGKCWGKKTVGSGGLETWRCNATANEECNSTITFTGNPAPQPVHPVYECGGGGSTDFNPTTHVAHANGAASGC